MVNRFPISEKLHADRPVVENQPRPLQNFNSFLADRALQEASEREGASWASTRLEAFGEICGSERVIELGYLANRHRPELRTHDHYGNRIDAVVYHPAYHELMTCAVKNQLHALPWSEPQPGAHAARAALNYMQAQVEAGHGCPITMSFAAVPTLRIQPGIANEWIPKLINEHYDPANSHYTSKKGYTIGMGMTEVQGGSDVRTNKTRAIAIGDHGPGEAYELVGHKYFLSAPMSDAFLMLAQAEGGISCFLVPRWRPDGTRNPLYLARLKDKMGNVSNASAEIELQGTFAWLIGEEGRGIANILEMVALTRFDCVIGSAGGMRQAVVQAIHHCRHRIAFGRELVAQPLMKNVLADLVLESEAAIAIGMRLARALDSNASVDAEKWIVRIGTAVAKYWVCKRAPNHAYEAMECLGGSGVMETTLMPRLYRDAPINSIWEGSGNIQCLDVLRVLQKMPQSLQFFMDDVLLAKGVNREFDLHTDRLTRMIAEPEHLEFRSRSLVSSLALAWQASVLIRAGHTLVSDAFCASRLGQSSGHTYGMLPPGIDCDAIIARAFPA